jgi:hypothetical protein
LLAAVTLSLGPAGAADKTKVNQATKRVNRGAKFSGENVKEFFTGKK